MGHKYNRNSTDKNHKPIVKALRDAGAVIVDTTSVKDAFDLMVFYDCRAYVMEIKNPDYLTKVYDREQLESKLSDGERKCMEDLQAVGVAYHIVASIAEALKVIGIEK
jgi:hypothetical protein